MKICIFCSANSNLDPDYFEMTRQLGTELAKNGHSIVFGGTNLGLMECVAKAAHEAGGQVIGVVPTKVEERGCSSTYMDVCIPCADLNDRKALMMAQSDVFIALPGGIGTLDEVFSVAASATIGYHQKPVILYNMNGYYESMRAVLDNILTHGFGKADYFRDVVFAEDLSQIIEALA